ncbi:MAG TPA: hypothetical protein VF522_14185 [Ramlibacter sp.]|uniref:hypothetical protein n=1 Tax=Ramlibacter sp. TaxID=1917967 RepID=UPI002ED4815D
MPIRTASMTKRISRNGQALHSAKMSRGEGDKPSEAEQVLLEERKQLKEERDKRQAQAMEPRPSAVERMVRTHHAQAKEKPATSKEMKDAKETRKPKARRTRAEKHAEQAAAVEAARNKSKKPAK